MTKAGLLLPQVHRQIDEITKDRSLGASELAKRGVSLVGDAARKIECDSPQSFLVELARVCTLVADSRPSMAVIENAISILFHRISLKARRLAIAALREAAAVEAGRLLASMDGNAEEASRRASGILKLGQAVVTHSYSSTVVGSLERSAAKGLKVMVGESRPLLEGRKAAVRLAKAGVAVTLMTDASMPYHVRDADAVLVGADTIFSDGWLLNKMGTYPLAMAARDAGVPFYVVAETMKFTFRSHRGARLEEMSPDELGDLSGLEGVRVRNVYFDLTPLRFITSIITEEGKLSPRKVRSKVDTFRKFYAERISVQRTGARRTSL